MKTHLINIFFIALPMTAVAQSNSGIELSTAVGGSEVVTPASENILNNKLDNLLTNNGFVKGINSQFVLQSNLDNSDPHIRFSFHKSSLNYYSLYITLSKISRGGDSFFRI